MCEDLHSCDECKVTGDSTLQPVTICMNIREDIQSWKDSMKMEFSKMRSESSECTWNAKAILIHLEKNLSI